MSEEYIPHVYGDAVKQALQQRGGWCVVAVDQSIGWSTEDLMIEFEGYGLIILGWDEANNLIPGVAIRCCDGLTEIQGRKIISRFLSALNWVSRGSIRDEGWMTGSHPIRTGFSGGTRYTSNYFRQAYLPQHHSEEAALALALLREGDGLRFIHSGYAFLSYYKILNLIKRTGEKQKKWMRRNLVEIDGDAEKRVAEISEFESDVAEYLYKSCRCAVAHAGEEPTLDPDDIEDSKRLSQDLPVIRALAKRIITDHFGIKSDSDIYREHKYELAGFANLIGAQLVEEILSGEIVPRRQVGLPTTISIRQWCDKRYGAFEGLLPKVKAVRDGVVTLDCVTKDNLLRIPVYLDFREDRLYVDVENCYISSEMGVQSLLRSIDCHEFLKDLIQNGEIEIFTTDDNVCLGRKDANLPVNIDMAATVEYFNQTIEGLHSRVANMEAEISQELPPDSGA